LVRSGGKLEMAYLSLSQDFEKAVRRYIRSDFCPVLAS